MPLRLAFTARYQGFVPGDVGVHAVAFHRPLAFGRGIGEFRHIHVSPIDELSVAGDPDHAAPGPLADQQPQLGGAKHPGEDMLIRGSLQRIAEPAWRCETSRGRYRHPTRSWRPAARPSAR